MKKIITFLLILLMTPSIVFAKEYKSMTLSEALNDEKIESDLGDYQESEDKANLYLFRGKGCSHCREFLEFVANDLIKDYGQYFNFVSYEVWKDEDNKDLMESVSEYLGEDAGGVPFIIIGERSFSGYSESMNDEIKEEIKKLYDSEDRYDVIQKVKTSPKKKASKKDATMTIVFILFAGVGLIVLIVTSLKKK